MAGGNERRLKVTKETSEQHVSESDWIIAEALIATLIARAYAADHPEIFGPHLASEIGGQADDSGK